MRSQAREKGNRDITISSQILNNSQTSLTIRDGGIIIMLLTILIDRKSLKVYVPSRTELGFNGPRDVDGRFHSELFDTVFHDGELDRNLTRHLNSATERNLTITLREVKIADAEFSTLDMHREIYFRAAREVLDIAIAAMFRTT